MPILRAQIGKSSFGEQFAAVDDADMVAEFFHFAHDVGGKDDGLAGVAAFADETGDGARGHDVQADGRLIENHDRGIVHQRARDGNFLLHSGGKLVAAAVAEIVHFKAREKFIDAAAQSGFVEAMQAAEIFDHFLRGEAAVQRRGCGKKPDARADFLRILGDIISGDDGGALRGREDRGEHAQRGGFAGAVRSEQAVNFSRAAGKTHAVDGAHGAAFPVTEPFHQMLSFNHSISFGEDAAQIVADQRGNLQEDGVSDRIQAADASLYGSWGTAWRQNFQA